MIDILITTFNSEKTVIECINSVPEYIMGERTNIIVSDDCSTDKTVSILAKIDNITLIRNYKNEGVGLNRNRLLTASKNKYIMFIDSDDEFELAYDGNEALGDEDMVILGRKIPTRKSECETIKQYLEKYIKQAGTTDKLCRYLNDKDIVLTECWGYIYRRDIISTKNIQFPAVTAYEDIAFLTKYILYSTTFKYCQGTMVCKGVDGGLSRGIGESYKIGVKQTFEYIQNIDLDGINEELVSYRKKVEKFMINQISIYSFDSLNGNAKLNEEYPTLKINEIKEIRKVHKLIMEIIEKIKAEFEKEAEIYVMFASPLSNTICESLNKQNVEVKGILDDKRSGFEINKVRVIDYMNWLDKHNKEDVDYLFVIPSLNTNVNNTVKHRIEKQVINSKVIVLA